MKKSIINKEHREKAIRENIKKLLKLQDKQRTGEDDLVDHLNNYQIRNKQIAEVVSYLKHLLK